MAAKPKSARRSPSVPTAAIPASLVRFTHRCTTTCRRFSATTYWSNVQAETFELYSRDQQRRIILSFKNEEDLYAIFVGLPIEELHDVRRDIEGAFMRSLELVPEFAERVRRTP